MSTLFPFTALVGQDRLKLALLVNAVDPRIGGVLVRGQKGTAKSTAVRALAALLPEIEITAGCRFNCPPGAPAEPCQVCRDPEAETATVPTPLVELPLGASEDRVAGSLDLERALSAGVHAFEPGLLARAHRGILYVDEVNLLTDHLVDLLLDAAAMGVNQVEREGVSVRHPARFLLVGTMNPEEGELRPQLLDRFGLTVQVDTPTDGELRAEVVRRRLAYERDPAGFAASFAPDEKDLTDRLLAARKRLPEVVLPERLLDRAVEVCAHFEVDGLRADVVVAKTATALAAWNERREVELADLRTACLLALPHRRRRGPFDQPGLDPEELDRVLGEDPGPEDPPGDDGPEEPEPDDPAHPDAVPGDQPDDPAAAPHADGAPPDGSDRPADARPGPENGAAPEEATTAAAAEPEATADDGHPADAAPAAPAAEQVLGVGGTFTPTLLTVPGVGAGTWGRRSPARGRHGATVGARPARATGAPRSEVAVAATLRGAVPHQATRGRVSGPLRVRADDVHVRVRQGREGNLVVFVVDASGSMAARTRMVAVKGAIRSLLLDAYQRRDKVALVTFRGTGADVSLPPTASTELADRRLAQLPTGGRTPLAVGLTRAREVLALEATRDPERRPLVVLLTDGRANASASDADPVEEAHRAARELAAHGTATVVVDTEEGFVRLGLARRLAASLAAPCLRLEELAAGPLASAVRAWTRSAT